MSKTANLSDRSMKVLEALKTAAAENGGDFGFMDEARAIVADQFTSHQFAGHIADLTKRGIIAWTEDLASYVGIETDGVQYGLAEEFTTV